MKKNGIGDVNTKTGLICEGKVDLEKNLCSQNGYSSKKDKNGFTEILFEDESVHISLKGMNFINF